MSNINPTSNLNTFRLEALEDGIFAIAMTLLVLNLKVPEKINGSLLKAIVLIWPQLLTYFGSFVLLGVFWFGHRAALHYIKTGDQNFHWINIILLMFVSVVPFSASLMANYYQEKAAIIFYGLNVVFIGLCIYVQFVYATKKFRLVDNELPDYVIHFAKLRSIFAPICYLIAMILSFIDVRISLIIYAIVPMLYILPFIQGFWKFLLNIKIHKNNTRN